MREFERWLPAVEPPPGGLARLQRSMASRHRRTGWSRTGLAWAASACVLIAIFAVSVPAWLARHRQTDAIATALRQGLPAQVPVDGIRVVDGAAIELPSGQHNVKLYLVQSAQALPRQPR